MLLHQQQRDRFCRGSDLLGGFRTHWGIALSSIGCMKKAICWAPTEKLYGIFWDLASALQILHFFFFTYTWPLLWDLNEAMKIRREDIKLLRSKMIYLFWWCCQAANRGPICAAAPARRLSSLGWAFNESWKGGHDARELAGKIWEALKNREKIWGYREACEHLAPPVPYTLWVCVSNRCKAEVTFKEGFGGRMSLQTVEGSSFHTLKVAQMQFDSGRYDTAAAGDVLVSGQRQSPTSL